MLKMFTDKHFETKNQKTQEKLNKLKNRVVFLLNLIVKLGLHFKA